MPDAYKTYFTHITMFKNVAKSLWPLHFHLSPDIVPFPMKKNICIKTKNKTLVREIFNKIGVTVQCSNYETYSLTVSVKNDQSRFSAWLQPPRRSARNTSLKSVVIRKWPSHSPKEKKKKQNLRFQHNWLWWASTPVSLTDTLQNLRGTVELWQYLHINLHEGREFPLH